MSDADKRLARVIEIGRVEEVDFSKGYQRVRMRTDDDRLSDWMRTGTPMAGENKLFSTYSIGEEVMFASQSGGTGGAVICALYNGETPANSKSPDDFILDFKDGSQIKVNMAGGGLTLVSSATMAFEAKDNMTFKAGGDVDFQSSSLNHNSKNIGHDHKHQDVVVGEAVSGVPQ